MKEILLEDYRIHFLSRYLDLNDVIKREKNNIDIENLQELESLLNFLLKLYTESTIKNKKQ